MMVSNTMMMISIMTMQETKSQTHDLIGQTTKLQMEGQKLQLRSQMVGDERVRARMDVNFINTLTHTNTHTHTLTHTQVEVFLKRFQLSEHEILALKGTKDGQLHQVTIHHFSPRHYFYLFHHHHLPSTTPP